MHLANDESQKWYVKLRLSVLTPHFQKLSRGFVADIGR